ncbi:hypothetical protein ACG7TL_005557 [Trametes sanguinea]
MASPIDADEVSAAIKDSAPGKAPGLDGLPAEVWKKYLAWTIAGRKAGTPHLDIGQALAAVFKDVEVYGVAEQTQFASGWICPIYKKGDPRSIDNYRPITLLNSDYKLLTRVLASRLVQPAIHLLHPDQAAFVPGRRILDHIKLVQTMLAFAEAEDAGGVIVALDQEKAYDRILHPYLWEVLTRMNFPQRFIRTVQSLYRAAESAVMINGTLSKPFRITRGVRQGDPMSCLLFNLAIEPLAHALRRSTLRGFQLPGVADRLITTLFADDTTVYLSKDDVYADLMELLERWCEASGAKFNVSKTEHVPLGQEATRAELVRSHTLPGGTLCLPPDVRITKDGEAIRVLGAWIGNNVAPETSWGPMVAKIKHNLERWALRRPTMYGRRLIVGLELGSRTQFLTAAQGMPAKIEKDLSDAALRFMWDGQARPQVAREMLYAPIQEGGLGLLDLQSRNEAIHLMWTKAYLSLQQERPRWAYLADALFAHTADAKSVKVPVDARSNPFLQRWEVSRRAKTGLPCDLQAVIKVAKKYRVELAPTLPDEPLKLAMPLWFHIGDSGKRSSANSAAAKCLRNRHAIYTVEDCVRLTSRLQTNRADCTPHRLAQDCECIPCKSDRETLGCPHPHRCAEAAQRALDRLKDLWRPDDLHPKDGLSLTPTRKLCNESAVPGEDEVWFDPTITTRLPMLNGFRLLADPAPNGAVVPRRPPKPFAVQDERITLYTDGSSIEARGLGRTAGSGVWFGIDDPRNLSVAVPGAVQTNQAAELFAVAVAAMVVPPHAPLTVVTDSRYVIDGLTVHLPSWEACGWLGITNAELIRDVAARLRARSAATSFRWVKGHSGVLGNEEADGLARAAATRPTPYAQPLPTAPLHFTSMGIQMSALTQRLAYMAIRSHRSVEYIRPATQRQLRHILASAERVWCTNIQASTLWKSLRHMDMRRELRDFWWKAIHGALRVGPYWRNIPTCEDRVTCAVCQAPETLEHILLNCDAPGQKIIWRLAKALLRKKHLELPELDLGGVLCTPAVSMRGLCDRTTAAADRLLRITMTESAHLVWKVRCERVIDTEANPPHCHTDVTIASRWLAAMNRRLALDQQLTRPIKGRVYLDRATVLRTWSGVLEDEASLPDDWVFRPRVLVGMPLLHHEFDVG